MKLFFVSQSEIDEIQNIIPETLKPIPGSLLEQFTKWLQIPMVTLITDRFPAFVQKMIGWWEICATVTFHLNILQLCKSWK